MKTRNSALFVMQLLLVGSLGSFGAQNNRVILKLQGTEWEVKIKQSPPDGMFQVATYAFGDRGKVVLTVVTGNAVWTPPRIQYNSPGSGRVLEERGRAVVVPGIDPASIVSTASEEGTYEQDGNSVHVEFPDHIVNATIKGTRIEGDIRYKSTGRKEKWVVTRLVRDSS